MRIQSPPSLIDINPSLEGHGNVHPKIPMAPWRWQSGRGGATSRPRHDHLVVSDLVRSSLGYRPGLGEIKAANKEAYPGVSLTLDVASCWRVHRSIVVRVQQEEVSSTPVPSVNNTGRPAVQVTGGQWARPTQRVSRPTGINGRSSGMRFRLESFTIAELRAALKRLCEEPHQQRRTTASCVKCGEIGFSKAFPTPQERYGLIPAPL
jgi:hypothetical protein